MHHTRLATAFVALIALGLASATLPADAGAAPKARGVFLPEPAASAEEVAPYSSNPAEDRPYALCPPPTKLRASCMAAVVPVEGGEPVVGPELQGSGKNGGFSPADLRSAYKLPATGGSGLTVAITIAYDNPKAESDLATYRSFYGLPPCTTANGCFTKVNQKGEAANYPAPNANWGLETSLDLDMVSAVCPECKILLVEADSNTVEDLGVAVEKAVELGADVVSNSWAAEEFAEETSANPYFSHPGVPALFASGDWGYGVYYPASSPDVVAVGGTSLVKAAGPRGWEETVWSGAGSGCSAYEEKPEWQKDAGCPNRTLTDVSAVSDTATPVSVYDSYEQSGWVLLGGTSVATPVLAGIEALSTANFRAAGPSAFTRAGNGGKLFDVTAGENGTCGAFSTTGFRATYLCQGTAGYDGPSGWGTPDGPLSLPVALTEGATVVAADEVTLHGSVDPRGLPTEYRFEYGETTAYGTSVPVPAASAGSESGYVEVSQLVAGLKARTPYHYRIVAENTGGVFPGVDRIFGTTPPTATTGAASDVLISSATLNAEVNPEGLPTRYYFEYGPDTSYGNKLPIVAPEIGPGTTPIAVDTEIKGLSGNEVYHYRVVAENVAGIDYGADESFVTTSSKWDAGYLPQPPNSGGGHQAFGVSCVQPDDCIAVGRNWDLGVHTHATLAEHWDGVSWTAMTTPNPPGLDEGWMYNRYAELQDVSCATTNFCVAVGRYKGADDVIRLLVERWDGNTWTMIAAPSPGNATVTRLTGVSCLSADDCTAAGFYRDSSNLTTPLIEHWDGEQWEIALLPSIPEASAARLSDVACATETNCVAVGQYLSTANTERTLAEHWNGSQWTVRSTVTPGARQEAALEAVSCPTTSSCTAVGYFRSGPTLEGLAERWNGTDWAVQPTPTPEEEGVLTGVSCSVPDACTAAGYYYSSLELDHGWRPLIERWQGIAWSPQEIDVLSAPAGWWRESSLNSISCPQAEACVAVGDALSGPPGGFSSYRAFAEQELTGPTASFTATPPAPIAGQTVQFDGSHSSSPAGPIASYEWDFGDGTQATGVAPSHAFDKAGDYLVTLVVTDDEGDTDEASRLVSVGNAPPVASFSFAPDAPVADLAVEFDGSSSSDVGGTVAGYAWDFGDGSHANGATPSHAFDKAGDYVVKLTVTDDEGGTGSTSRLLSVAPGSDQEEEEEEEKGKKEEPPPSQAIPPVAEVLPPPFSGFEISRTVTRCNGQIVLTMNAPLAGAFEARAAASTRGNSRSQGHRAPGGNGLCGTKRVSADSRRSTDYRAAGANGPFPYGRGSATAAGAGRYNLVITPTEKARKAIRDRRTLHVEIAVTFTPLDGAPSSKRKVISLRPR